MIDMIAEQGGAVTMKDWLPILVSSLALSVSVLNAYWNIFRRERLHLLLSGIEIVKANPFNHHLTALMAQVATFTNLGNRPAAILGASLFINAISPPPESENANWINVLFELDLVPFAIKPGEVVVREIKIKPTVTFGVEGDREWTVTPLKVTEEGVHISVQLVVFFADSLSKYRSTTITLSEDRKFIDSSKDCHLRKQEVSQTVELLSLNGLSFLKAGSPQNRKNG